MKAHLVLALIALALACAGCSGCCDGGSDEEPMGRVVVTNNTPYFLHFLHPEQNSLYVEPGASEGWEVSGSREITILVSPGQDAKGLVKGQAECCSGGQSMSCASFVVSWELDQLSAAATPPVCTGGGGSCPYVYSGDRLEGESLVGALNRGAARHDVLVLSQLSSEDGSYPVRIAAELDETDYIDAVWLELVEHPAGSRIVKDSTGTLHQVKTPLASRRAIDSGDRELGYLLDADDDRHWQGRSLDRRLDGKIRDWVELSFPRPAGKPQALLLIRGRNTQLLQDAYHEYLANFGPGLPKLMRLMTSMGPYRARLDRYLAESGFSLEVGMQDGDGFRAVPPVRPVGPAAEQTIAVPLELPAEGPAELRVRLATLPGAWLVDSVEMSCDRAASISSQRLDPRSASRTRADSAKASPDTLAAIASEDGSTLEIETGDSLMLRFPAPSASPPPGSERTAVLHVVGYYEENDHSRRPCVKWKRLLNASRRDNSFGEHIRDRLSFQNVVDRYAEEAGIRRSR